MAFEGPDPPFFLLLKSQVAIYRNHLLLSMNFFQKYFTNLIHEAEVNNILKENVLKCL